MNKQKPWYTKWWAITLMFIVALSIYTSLFSSSNTSIDYEEMNKDMQKAKELIDRGPATLPTAPEGVEPPAEEPIEEPEDETPAETPICFCSSNMYNCADFSSQAEAQECFEYCGGISNDVHILDRDKDNIACEALS